MRYTIRRIAPLSALRVGLVLGWLIALLPALALAFLATTTIESVASALGDVQNFELTVLGQQIANVDVLALLGLRDTAGRLSELSAMGTGLFLLITLGLTLLGGLGVALTALLFSLGYNLLASLSGGIAVELGPDLDVPDK